MLTIDVARTVPVQEDLTKDETRLSVLRGIEKMYRVDKPLAASTQLLLGEWGVLNSEGKLERPGSVGLPNTYLVFAGSERYDVVATGKVTTIFGSHIVASTDQFDTGVDYEVGDALTAKDYGGGAAGLTKASEPDAVLARVVEFVAGKLTFETVRN
jgi:hypothetical protein